MLQKLHILPAGLTLLFACTAVLSGQDAITALPRNYHLTMENQQVRVVHVRYGARERLPIHDHPQGPTVYVYLTDSGPVRFNHKGEPALVRRPVKAGGFRVSPGRSQERHMVVNLGEIPSEFLRVELKQIPLGVGTMHFRGVKPFDLTHAGQTREFSHEKLAVDRIIVPAKQSVSVAPSSKGFLLVAISPVHAQASSEEKIEAGRVRWVQPDEPISLRPASGVSGHALRIEMMDGRSNTR